LIGKVKWEDSKTFVRDAGFSWRGR